MILNKPVGPLFSYTTCWELSSKSCPKDGIDMFLQSFHKQFPLLLKQVFGKIKMPHPSNKLLSKLMVIHDVVTQWNYTHAMIKWALLLQKVSLVFSFIPFPPPNSPSQGH
jgi:hypothetical protein